MEELSKFIVDVRDFPKPDIVFKDFTPLLANAKALSLAVELMANPFRGAGVDVVAGAESRGFIFGTAVAQALGAGFVPIRKSGKLPRKTRGITYALEYGTDRLEIHTDAFKPGARVLIVDDLLATGGTLEACCRLVAEAGGTIAGISVLIELKALNGRSRVSHFGDAQAVLVY